MIAGFKATVAAKDKNVDYVGRWNRTATEGL